MDNGEARSSEAPRSMLEAVVEVIGNTQDLIDLTDSDDEDGPHMVVPSGVIRRRREFARRLTEFTRRRMTQRIIEDRIFEEDTAVALRESIRSYTPQVSTTTRKQVEKHFPEYKARLQKDKCSVCLEHLKRGDMMRTLPCFHYLHSECLVGWFTQGNTVCPICRHKVSFQKKRKRV
jgi:hypothetical protein